MMRSSIHRAGPRARRAALALLAAGLAAGCSAADRVASIGEQPPLSAIDNPTSHPGYKPVRMPMPAPAYASHESNSLWRSGARAFFKDQRARQVGDILTVRVAITDKAEIDNKSSRSRSGSEGVDIGMLAGYETLLPQLLPGAPTGADLVELSGSTEHEGEGKVNRKETLTTSIAAVVTQLRPNRTLVIEGRQEVRVNFEVRELIIAGIVRPEDIGADNTIASSKIAEARIAYGGRGQITDVQQPRYGQQFLDVLLPF
jgi:flagellar L-ring protein precursor FlgH